MKSAVKFLKTNFGCVQIFSVERDLFDDLCGPKLTLINRLLNKKYKVTMHNNIKSVKNVQTHQQ